MRRSAKSKPKWERQREGTIFRHSLRIGKYELVIWNKRYAKHFANGIFSYHTGKGRLGLDSNPQPITATTLAEAKQQLLSILDKMMIEETKEMIDARTRQ
ncbi:MAG: hypothetical protein AAB575_06065 [Patescibacteria group bacterium]